MLKIQKIDYTNTNKSRQSRSSLIFCNERYNCKIISAVAQFYCLHCKSYQCSDCEKYLHLLANFKFHKRHKVLSPDNSILCSPSTVNCVSKNFADVTCNLCGCNLCFDCDFKLHNKSTFKNHKRLPFNRLQKEEKNSGINERALFLPINFSIKQPQKDINNNHNNTGSLVPPVEFADLFGSTASLNLTKELSSIYFDCLDSTMISENKNKKVVKDYTFIQTPLTDNNVKGTTPISTQPQKIPKENKGSSDHFDDVTFNDVDDRSSSLHNATMCDQHIHSNNIIDVDEELINQMSSSLLVEMKAKSFPLVNQNEELLIMDEKDFVDQLECSEGSHVKVVSIFGNTGDGKSHTLNHTFFNGESVFKTSNQQNTCTIGVWAAYDDLHGAIVLDTEGLLGVSANHNQRTRLLLKILAISDIVIYRTRAERLHSDLFQFLGDASQAYLKHFILQLRAASKRLQLDSNSYTTLGPCLTIFHETLHTDILAKGATEPAEKLVRDRFHEMNLNCDAFSSIHYVGTKTLNGPTNFSGLLVAIKKQLLNNEIRCSRNPAVVFQTLKILNEKFAGSIDREIPNMFPDQYFTCRAQCHACLARCVHTMNHSLDEQPHEAHTTSRCKHHPQFQNTVYTCKACHKRGQTVVVVPKTSASTESSWLSLANYAWSGYVLECINCGVIYRSRQHWYGNPDPEKTVVRTEIQHVWPGGSMVLQGTHNAARRLVDGIHYVSDTIAGVGAGPAKAVSNWMADKIAPPYWELNADIKTCRKCEKLFDEDTPIHHCRSCGKGFCEACSSKKRPVPERNWGMTPVRVCDDCHTSTNVDHFGELEASVDTSHLVPRMVGEAFGSTVTVLSQIVNYPLVALKDAARPAYWVPDEEIKDCCICKRPLSNNVMTSSTTYLPSSNHMTQPSKQTQNDSNVLNNSQEETSNRSSSMKHLKVHHCRACGQGVCGSCSTNQRPVRSRGWDHPVRVCNQCFDRKDL